MKGTPLFRRKSVSVTLLAAVVLLLLLGWSQASFDLSRYIRPSSAQETLLLPALSVLNFVAFIIFALILWRIRLKLYAERQQAQLGSKFKTKMVVAFLALSLVPVGFLFAFAYGLLNRSVDKWFGIPFDVVRRDSSAVVRELRASNENRLRELTRHVAQDGDLRDDLSRRNSAALERLLAARTAEDGLDAAACFDSAGKLVAVAGGTRAHGAILNFAVTVKSEAASLPVKRVESGGEELLVAFAPVLMAGRRLGSVALATQSSRDAMRMAAEIDRESAKYDELTRERKAVRRLYLSTLALVTLLILFVATWWALFVSRQVTVPIQALAEGTHQVARGNLAFQVSVRSDDELGTLIRSFNEMTRQLEESRQALERAASDLQRANRELEERGHTLAAILENIPAGVISLDTEGRITRVNPTAERMLGAEKVRSAAKLADLFAAEDAREVARLVRRAARQGIVTRQMDLDLAGRRATAGLTVSSIRTGGRPAGTVLVLEDLTELLRAQKSAAWQEVAQRIAHEIKNPLTPIQLSSERIGRLVERAESSSATSEVPRAVAESAALIAREAATLKQLVDEFSEFARFPASRPVPSNLNAIVANALDVFDGRLEGIVVHRELAAGLPSVEADPEQMKRAIVNLIDNAAEALGRSSAGEIWVRTAAHPEREVVELAVADGGPGVAADDLERLFLPYFSTKRRGTGLGLAIVGRIVAEHHGTIRVERNRPRGARFIIELPVRGEHVQGEPARGESAPGKSSERAPGGNAA